MPTLRLTYAQLGEWIGRSPEAARQLARRQHWQVIPGNDGRAMVVVDETDLDGRTAVRTPVGQAVEQPVAAAPDGLDQEHRERMKELREAVEQRTTELLAMTARAAHAEGEAKALRDALADLSGRLDRAEARLAMPWWRRLLG